MHHGAAHTSAKQRCLADSFALQLMLGGRDGSARFLTDFARSPLAPPPHPGGQPPHQVTPTRTGEVQAAAEPHASRASTPAPHQSAPQKARKTRACAHVVRRRRSCGGGVAGGSNLACSVGSRSGGRPAAARSPERASFRVALRALGALGSVPGSSSGLPRSASRPISALVAAIFAHTRARSAHFGASVSERPSFGPLPP